MALGLDSGDHERPLSEINVTPLVDVMLVLLVIFILLAPLFAQALRVDLPRTGAPPLTEPTVVDLVVTADGGLRLDGEPLAAGALAAELGRRMAAEPRLVLRLGADRATPYQRLAEVLSRLEEMGVRRLAFAVRAPGPRAEGRGADE